MRPLTILATFALAAAEFALAACDQTPQATSQLPSTRCRCTEAPAAAAPLQTADSEGRRVRHVHRWAYENRSAWHDQEIWREGERSASTYEHESDAYGASGGDYAHEDEHAGDEAHYAMWIDGYGRRHAEFADDTHGEREPHGARDSDYAPADEDARLDPWHGYDDHDGLENGY